jgi:hypothetical protein
MSTGMGLAQLSGLAGMTMLAIGLPGASLTEAGRMLFPHLAAPRYPHSSVQHSNQPVEDGGDDSALPTGICRTHTND